MNSEKEMEIYQRLISVEERGKSNTHRINDIESDIENIRTTEATVEKHDEDIKELKKQASVIYKLAVNQEVMNNTLNVMVDDNRKQMATFTETLTNMNDSLIHISQTQEKMSSEVTGMKKEIQSTKDHIKEVESLANRNRDDMNFNVMKFLSSDATKVIFTAIIVAILSYVGLK